MSDTNKKWSDRGKEYVRTSKFKALVDDVLEESNTQRILTNLKKPSELYEENVGTMEGPMEAPSSAYARAIKNSFKEQGELPIEEKRDLFKNLKSKTTKRVAPSIEGIKNMAKEEEEHKKKYERGIAMFLKSIEAQKMDEVEGLDHLEVDGDSNALLQQMGGSYEDYESEECKDEDQELDMDLYRTRKTRLPREDQEEPSKEYSVEALYNYLEEITKALEEGDLSKEDKIKIKGMAIKVKKMVDGGVHKGTYLNAKSIENALDSLEEVLGEGFNNYTQEVVVVENAYTPYLSKMLK